MIRLEQYKRETLPLGQDYIFDKIADFHKLEDYFKYPKIDGKWGVSLVDMKADEIYSILDVEQPECINLTIYLKKDVLDYILAKYPKYEVVQKSKWEEYLEIIGAFPMQIEKRASSELFKRAHGNSKVIRETLSELETLFYGEETITVKHLNSVLLREDTVYARDVILTAMLRDDESVPRKGHRLSKYRYGSVDNLVDKLIQEIGRDVTFYSLRKFCKRLYDEKMKFLEKGECKEMDVIKILDVYEITHAYLNFFMSNPLQLTTIMYNIQRRRNNDSLFERTVLANHTKRVGING